MASEYLVNYDVALWLLISALKLFFVRGLSSSIQFAETVRPLLCRLLFISAAAAAAISNTAHHSLPYCSNKQWICVCSVQYRNLIYRSMGLMVLSSTQWAVMRLWQAEGGTMAARSFLLYLCVFFPFVLICKNKSLSSHCTHTQLFSSDEHLHLWKKCCWQT